MGGALTSQLSPAGALTNSGALAALRTARLSQVLLALALAASFFALTSLGSRPASAQTPTDTPAPSTLVRLDPVSQSVVAPSQVVVNVVVDGVSDLGAYEFELRFAPDVLTFASATNGLFLGSTGRTVQCFPAVVDATLGTVRFACVTTGASPPGPAGTGVLATLYFATTCSGSSPLDLRSVSLSRPLGTAIIAQTQSASANVTGGGVCPTPGPTVTPTQMVPGFETSTPTVTPTPTQGPTPTPVPQQCGSGTAATVCVVPVSSIASAGSQFTIQVAVDRVTDLGAFQFDLVFNNTLLSPVAVTVAPFLGSTGRSTVCLPTIAPDRVQLSCSTLGSAPPGPSGNGFLANVTLQALGPIGLSFLHLENVLVLAVNSSPIAASTQDGVVTIQPAPTATPLPSATPTFTFTPTATGPTATVTGTPTDTETPTVTETPTQTSTPTPCLPEGCPTGTSTSTPTDTSTATATRTPTSTSTPTLTPTPGPCGLTAAFTVCLRPVSQGVSLGANATVDVVVANTQELGALQFTLSFNPAIVSGVDVAEGPFLSSTGRLVNCLEPPRDAGFLEFSCVTLGPTPSGPIGSGVLATVTLRGENAGLTPLSMQDVILTDVSGLAYPAPVLQGAAIFVTVPTPTNTPTITSTPTETPSPTPCPPEGCPTPTVTLTPTITPTRTITRTPTNTLTPQPTATLTPTPGPLTLRIVPVSQSVAVGEAALVSIVVDNARNLGAFELTIAYNPSVVAFESIFVDAFLGSTGRSVLCLPPAFGPGSVQFSCNTLGSTPNGPDGSGSLAVATFRAGAQGLSPLHLSNAFLTDITSALLLPLTTQDASVLITQAPPPPDTPTPTATATPAPLVAARAGRPFAIVLRAADGVPLAVAGPGLQQVPPRSRGNPQVAPVVSVLKDPTAANLFLGAGDLKIVERVVGVPEGNGLGTFQLRVTYNPIVVSIDIAEGPFLTSTGRVSQCQTARVQGQILLSCASFGSEPGPTGDGDLALITVRPVESTNKLTAKPGNGIEVLLDDVSGATQLADTLGSPINVSYVGDARVVVRVLEGDINTDCIVDVIDQQMVAGRFGYRKGSLQYSERYDLEGHGVPDGDIDVNDLQVVYGRDGSTCANPWTSQPPPSNETGTPTLSPTATVTPTGTRPTLTPASTQTASPTVTPTSTGNTAGKTETPTPTVTPTGTLPTGSTPTPTVTPTGTLPTPAGTPTITPTSVLATATHTITPTSVLAMATPTVTPTLPIPTPTGVLPDVTPTGTVVVRLTATPTEVIGGSQPTPTSTPPTVVVSPTSTQPQPGAVVTPTRTLLSSASPSARTPAPGLPSTGTGFSLSPSEGAPFYRSLSVVALISAAVALMAFALSRTPDGQVLPAGQSLLVRVRPLDNFAALLEALTVLGSTNGVGRARALRQQYGEGLFRVTLSSDTTQERLLRAIRRALGRGARLERDREDPHA